MFYAMKQTSMIAVLAFIIMILLKCIKNAQIIIKDCQSNLYHEIIPHENNMALMLTNLKTKSLFHVQGQQCHVRQCHKNKLWTRL